MNKLKNFWIDISKNKFLLPVILLIVSGFFIYSFNLNNKLFWDDEDWILNNVFVHEISWDTVKFWFTNNTLAGVGQKSNYYRPLLFFTFAINYVISGAKPFFYHLFSNAIHIANGILIYFLINSLLKNMAVAFLTSLIFLIHPLQTEAITYIAGRGDSLVAMFMLLSLLLFYKFLTSPVKNFQLAMLKALSLVFLALGLLSRETAIMFPFLALALYIAFISGDRFTVSIKKGLFKVWPYFGVVIVYGILRLTALNFLNILNFYAEPNIYSENLYVRLLTFLPILWGYLKLLIIPAGLHMERSAVVYTSVFQWPVWPVLLALIGLLLLLRYLYIQSIKHKIQGTNFRVWLFGLSWFFICLGPVSGITPINALMYEHWLYLPMVGFWLIISFYLVKVFDYLRLNKNLAGYFMLSGALIIYFTFFGYRSIQRNILWGNPPEFYKNILKYEPDSARINNNIGNLYFNDKDVENAEYYYRKAIEIEDIFAQPYYNLGSILQSKGDLYGAIKMYEKAIEINPNFSYPYQALAVIYAEQGNLKKTIEYIEKLKTLLPENPRVYYNAALISIALKNHEQALIDLKTGAKYSRFDPEAGALIEDLIKELEK